MTQVSVEPREQELQLLRELAQRHGFELLAPHMVWRQQPFFTAAIEEGGKIHGIPLHRCFVLQSALRGLKNIPGDVAECGIRAGRSAYFMLMACEQDREFHLFDSFEGLSEPTSEDEIEQTGAPHSRKGTYAVPEEKVRRNLSKFSNWRAYRGWIPSRFEEVADRQFAFVHVDVDLYEPTRDSLAFFFPRIATGGAIVCDDYGSGFYPGARRAVDEFVEQERAPIVELPTGQALIWKVT